MADDQKNASPPKLELSEVIKGMPKAAEGMKKAKDLIDGLASFSGGEGGGTKKLNAAKAAVDVLAYFGDSYLKGKREGVEFNNARLASGNAAGLSNDQLQEIALRIKGKDGTQAHASEVLAALVATGKVQGSVMTEVATATADMNRLQGVPIADAVANFVKLRNEPTKTSIELNRSGSRYMSGEMLQRIGRLEAQGNVEAAGSLAQKAYAEDRTQIARQQDANRIIEDRTVSVVSNSVKRLDDFVRGFGRDRTLQQKIDWAEEVYTRQLQQEASKGGKSPGGLFTGGPRVSLEERGRDVEALKETRRLDRRSADAQADNAAKNSGAFEAAAEAWEAGDRGKKAQGSAAGASGEVAAKRPTPRGAARTAASTGIQRAEGDGLRPCIEIACGCKAGMPDSSKQAARTGQAGEAGRCQGASSESAEQAGLDSEGVRQANLLEAMRKATSGVLEQTTALEAQNAAHGKTKSAVQELNIAQLERQYRDLDNTDKVIPGYLEVLGLRIDAEKQLLKVTRDAEGVKAGDEEKKKNEDKAKKMSDDIGGVFRDGFVNLLDGGGKDAIDKMGEALKKKLVKSLADAFYDATLKDAVEGFSNWLTGAVKNPSSGGGGSASNGGGLSGLGGIFGAVSGLFGGFSGSTAASIANVVGGNDTLGTMISMMALGSAKGNVFASPGLHTYANSVVGQPTFFPFANGIGLMGEAGPEAIMPLRRGPDGRLGVSAPGTASAAPTLQFAPSNVFHIDARADRGAVMADMQRLLAENNRGQMEQLKRVKVLPQ